jgi:hypothetical protein
MYVVFEIQIDPMLKDSKHMVNLVLDESASTEGTYTFALHHNAFGETFKQKEPEELVPDVNPMADDSINWGFAGSYVSFPIADLIEEKEAKIVLKWKSHIITDFAWSAKVEDKTREFLYSKDSFEHAPLHIKTKTAAQVR